MTSLRGPLLVVDDVPEIRRSLVRYFKRTFETVSAATPAETEAILAESAPPFLLCDYWLGVEFPPSTHYIPMWRQRFPSLQRVALMTGTKSSSIDSRAGIDALFEKPLDLQAIIQFFAEAEAPTSGTTEPR